MEVNAPSFASPLASVRDAHSLIPSQFEYVVDAVSNAGLWTIAFTVLAILVAYDQSMSLVCVNTTQTLKLTLLASQSVISKKRETSWARPLRRLSSDHS